jgi:hypothetical protein
LEVDYAYRNSKILRRTFIIPAAVGKKRGEMYFAKTKENKTGITN